MTAKSRLFLYSAAIALFLLASGLLIRWGEGFPKRIGAAVRAYEAGARDRVAGYDERPVLTYGQKHIPRLIGEKEKKPSFWIWGDSWAISWAEAIEELADEYEVSGRESAMHGCRPVYDNNNSYKYPHQKDTADGCRIMNDAALELMEMYHEAEKYGLRILPISPKICGGDYCALADRRGSFYMDDYHLSVYGTRYFRDSLRPVFEEISRR